MTLEIISGWHFLKVNYKLLSPTMIHIATVVFMQQLTSLEISERDLCMWLQKRSLFVAVFPIMLLKTLQCRAVGDKTKHL